MKNYKHYFALFLIVLASAATTFADVKIKIKQTAGGQNSENTTYIKGKRERAERNIGEMQMVYLTQCDLKRSVQLNEATKTYLISLYNQQSEAGATANASTGADGVVRAGGTITSTVTYKDLGETRKMFGYNAKHILTKMEMVSSPDACSPSNMKMEVDGWYIDAAFALDCDQGVMGSYGGNQKTGCQDKYQSKIVGNAKRGYPVYEKMTMFDESGKETYSTVSEVLELSQATLDQALFEVPADYREVKNQSEMFSMTATASIKNTNSTTMPGMPNNSGAANSGSLSNIQKQTESNASNSGETSAKQPGVVRIGIVTKTGAVGDGVTAADLAAAVQNTLGEYLKGTKIEIVPLQAKLAALIDNEAMQKECDYVLLANVSHKKGGGGLFGKAAGGMLGSVIPMAGGAGAAIAGQVASTVITSASASASVKSKDEITLDIVLKQPGGAAVLTQQFKAKAKSDGDDIISAVVEQAANAIVGKAN